MTDQPSSPEPTAGALANVAPRQAIAARQLEEYAQLLKWVMGAFGRGWKPSGRHYLVDMLLEPHPPTGTAAVGQRRCSRSRTTRPAAPAGRFSS